MSAGYSHICADTTVEKPDQSPHEYSQIHCWGSNNRNESETNPDWHSMGTPWQISAGLEYTCAILRQSVLVSNNNLSGNGATVNENTIKKTAICWGSNEFGQTDIPAGMNGKLQQISAGGGHTCAQHGKNRKVYCWGLNKNGQTVVPAVVNEIARKLMATLSKPEEMFKGLHVKNGLRHSCVLAVFEFELMGGERALPANNLLCWGWNRQDQSSPPNQGRLVVSEFDLGQRHSCAYFIKPSVTEADAHIQEDLVCWGSNKEGQLDVPQEYKHIELYGPNVTVVAGQDHNCAYSSDDTVLNKTCWGNNEHEQCNI